MATKIARTSSVLSDGSENNNNINNFNLRATMARTNLDSTPSYMNGQSAAITYDAIEITDATTFASFLNPKILPNIETGTTESGGSEADTTETQNEQGSVVFQNTTPGTTAFTFTGMSTSKAAFAFFTNGTETPDLSVNDLTDTNDSFGKGVAQKLEAYGMNSFKNFIRPFGIINGTGDQMIFFPKASWSVSFTGAPGNAGYLGFTCTVTALDVKTQNLSTVMMLKTKA